MDKTVLLINGSPRKNGETVGCLKLVENVLNEHGISTKWIHLGNKPVKGCIQCNKCAETSRCIFDDDLCNEIIDAITDADAAVIGTPVYFAAPNGALCAVLDRVFYAASDHGKLFVDKPVAALATCWRAGATAALDRLYKYFTYAQMQIITSSKYWNIKLEGDDAFGEETIKQLAECIAERVMR